jgi:hypothetical protein
VVLELDAFAWEALAAESADLEVQVDELVTFSVLYYLADRDSGRIARNLPTAETVEPAGNPLEKLLGG